MALPVNTAPFSNTPANTNVIDADQVNTKFDRLFSYLQNGVETAGVQDKAVTSAKLGVIPAARVVRPSAFAVPVGAATTIPFSSADFDPASMWGGGSSLTLPRDGLYMVKGSFQWSGGPPGSGHISIWVNGATGQLENFGGSIGNVYATEYQVDVLQRFTAGTYLELEVGVGVAGQSVSLASLTVAWLGALA